ncbi:MAG: GNAT family N-acetyltransferase [Gammaproteobacteria bacterium]|nr:GNAT family N-acetyltransferase [Gammaproteobacteria bacterium]
MISHGVIRLANRRDIPYIAVLSRDSVEQGLGWSWTAARVGKSLQDESTNVVVASTATKLLGFGIMEYNLNDAHLVLLAVDPTVRRQGIGSRLMAWLELTCSTAGIGNIGLEARVINTRARTFYYRLGYHEINIIPRFYHGREDAVRMMKKLW